METSGRMKGGGAALLGVLLVAALLRFGALGWGLPRHDLGQDELVTLGRVTVDPLRSTPGAPLYNWPNLNVHLSRLALGATRATERALGREAADPVLIGRALVAVLGCLGIYWLYLAGRRLFDRRVGLLAAAFLAVIPLHAFRSRLWVPDVPMTTFYILALLAAVLILERPRPARFALAGLAVGLATAAKYNGVSACLPVAVAAVMVAVRRRRRGEPAAVGSSAAGLALAAAVSVATFFLADPPALTQLDAVLRGAGWVSDLYRAEPPTGFLGWHLIRFVAVSYFAPGFEGVGPVVCLLALAGWVVLVRRRSAAGVMVWLPPLLYLLIWGSLLRTAYERAFMPLLPHLALAAAVAADALGRRLESWFRPRLTRGPVAGWIGAALVLAALPPPAAHAWAARHGDTRLEALRWIVSEVPTGAAIVREWDMVLPPRGLFEVNKTPVRLFDLARKPRELTRNYDFVLSSSATSQWVMRQRDRPGFGERAKFYERLASSRRFELAARFAPHLGAFGPEILIYRSRPPRGPRVKATDEVVPLRRGVWANAVRLRKGRGTGRFYFLRSGDLVAGKAVLLTGGRYRIRAVAAAERPVEVELRLGPRRRTIRVEGTGEIGVTARLPAGQVWWSLERKSKGQRRDPSPAMVSELALERVNPATADGGR